MPTLVAAGLAPAKPRIRSAGSGHVRLRIIPIMRILQTAAALSVVGCCTGPMACIGFASRGSPGLRPMGTACPCHGRSRRPVSGKPEWTRSRRTGWDAPRVNGTHAFSVRVGAASLPVSGCVPPRCVPRPTGLAAPWRHVVPLPRRVVLPPAGLGVPPRRCAASRPGT